MGGNDLSSVDTGFADLSPEVTWDPTDQDSGKAKTPPGFLSTGKGFSTGNPDTKEHGHQNNEGVGGCIQAHHGVRLRASPPVRDFWMVTANSFTRIAWSTIPH